MIKLLTHSLSLWSNYNRYSEQVSYSLTTSFKEKGPKPLSLFDDELRESISLADAEFLVVSCSFSYYECKSDIPKGFLLKLSFVVYDEIFWVQALSGPKADEDAFIALSEYYVRLLAVVLRHSDVELARINTSFQGFLDTPKLGLRQTGCKPSLFQFS